MKRLIYVINILLFLVIFLLMGCSATRIKSSADREVYKILEKKTKEVTPEKIPWDIEFPSNTGDSFRRYSFNS